jgi:rhamnosyl/mannosyltransferase
MRILHIGKYYPPYQGGMETVLENLVLGLMEAGQEVAVLVAGQGPSQVREAIVHQEGTADLVRLANLGVWNSQPLTPGIVSALRRLLTQFRPDLVHLHLPNPLLGAAWRLLGLFPGHPALPPYVVWHHADITRQKLGRRLLAPSVRHLLENARGICVSSDSLVHGSPVLTRFSEKIRVVPFGLDPAPWASVTSDFSGRFLFVGRLVRYKGLEVLLKAVAKVPQVRLDLVGEGPLKRDLASTLTRLRLGDRVRLRGALSSAELLTAMSTAKGLVLPSLDASETFGLVQLEAMAAGLPVIASDLDTGVREVGVHGLTGLLVAPGQVAPLAEALDRLDRDPALARQLGSAGRARFMAQFTRQKMIDNLMQWYISLLQDPCSPDGAS